jgi:hypothetical protein
MNEKAKSYAVCFFNGRVKIISKDNKQELVPLRALHEDQITDALFLNTEQKLLVTASMDQELKVSLF